MSIAVLLAALLASAHLPAPVYRLAEPPPSTAAFNAECFARRATQTCVCMGQSLLRTGDGQFALERIAARQTGNDDSAQLAALAAGHGVAPDGLRALRRAGEQRLKQALAACR